MCEHDREFPSFLTSAQKSPLAVIFAFARRHLIGTRVGVEITNAKPYGTNLASQEGRERRKNERASHRRRTGVRQRACSFIEITFMKSAQASFLP